MMHYFKIIALTALLGVSFSANAMSIMVFNTTMTGEEANAGQGTGSPGKGAATMALDLDTGEFQWFVTWENLSGPSTASHFHTGAPGNNGFVALIFDHTSNPTIGSAVLSQDQIDNLLAGLWYINIHTDAFPGGEIRGQVLALTPIPIPAAIWLLGTALLGLGGFAQRR